MTAVIVSIRVDATPLRAFEAFTAEIGNWWRPNPLFMLTPRGDGELRFEPGEGGRLVAALPNGGEFEVGRITIWRPGERLALSWRQATFAPGQSTELDVGFEAVGDQTRVTVEHRGWDEIPRDHVARHGFELMLPAGRTLACAARCARRNSAAQPRLMGGRRGKSAADMCDQARLGVRDRGKHGRHQDAQHRDVFAGGVTHDCSKRETRDILVLLKIAVHGERRQMALT